MPDLDQELKDARRFGEMMHRFQLSQQRETVLQKIDTGFWDTVADHRYGKLALRRYAAEYKRAQRDRKG